MLLLLVPAIARAQTVSYTVSIPKPTSSLLHVVMDIRGAQGPSVDIAMPVWSPGSYNLHWAAKNVQRLAAQDGNGRALAAAMVDTSVWRIKPAAPAIRVTYDVYMGTGDRQRHARDHRRHALADVSRRARAVSRAGRADRHG